MTTPNESAGKVAIVKGGELALIRSAPLARRGLDSIQHIFSRQIFLDRGYLLLHKGELKKALKLFRQGTRIHDADPDLHYVAGVMMILGLGVDQDLTQGFQHVGEASRRGSQAANLLLSASFFFSKTFGEMRGQSLHLYFGSIAIDREPTAQLLMGILLEFGWGFDADSEMAIQWYKLAQKSGVPFPSQRSPLQEVVAPANVMDSKPEHTTVLTRIF